MATFPEEVRKEAYGTINALDWGRDAYDPIEPTTEEIFDAVAPVIAAAAWDEGYAAGFGDGGVNAWDPSNPYLGESR
jgi:hypothetical protein